jgi:hypothetical protein
VSKDELKLLAELSEAPDGFIRGDLVSFYECWWWVSFADSKRPIGDQFLGVAIIKAPEPLIGAMSWSRECNPGGEMFYVQVPDEYGDPPEEWKNKLISDKARIDELTQQWHGCGCKTLAEFDEDGLDD